MRLRPTSSTGASTAWRLSALVGIVILGALLRFYGLRWGLPNSIHDYSYHPDEFLTIGASFGRVFVHRTFDPGFYNYPSLYIYLSALAIAVGFGYGVGGTFTNIYLMARCVTALMGSAAVAVTYWAGKVNFGAGAGLIAALILCVAPLHVQHSHFATVDVPSTLFVAAALGFSGMILRGGSWRSYLLGGAMAGLAAGTKYNAGLVLLSVIAAHFLCRGGWRMLVSGRLWSAIGCAVAAFVISTPGSILRYGEFRHGLGYELNHAAQGHGLVFVGTGNGFVYTLVSSLWYGLGPTVVLFLPAVVLALAKRHKPALAMLAFVIPYYALISLSQVRFARYALPMLPGIAILIGWFVVEVWSAIRSRVGRIAWAAVCGVILCWTLAVSLIWTAMFGMPDPRDQAVRWIRQHPPESYKFCVIDVPWFYSPPLSRNLGFGTLDQRREAMLNTDYWLVPFDVTRQPEWFERHGTTSWSIISDYETSDAVRLRHNLSIPEDLRAQVDRVLRILDMVNRYYVLRQRFGGVPSALPHLGFANPPHDMRYVRPLISIHRGTGR